MERNWESQWGVATKLIHGGRTLRKSEHASLNPPLILDIAPVQPSVAIAKKSFGDPYSGFTYRRKGDPVTQVFEKKYALLEGAEDALAFATGMAAIACTLLELIPKGAHLVSQHSIYGGTFGFLSTDFEDAGRSVTFVREPLNIREWRAAFKNNTRAVLVEMPSNPTVGLVDLKEVVKVANEYHVPVIVDNTFAPLLLKPIAHGATYVLHSGSKYLNPGNIAMSGLLAGPHKTISVIRSGRFERYGATLSPFDAYLSIISLPTLPIRMIQQSESAHEMAEWFMSRREVSYVHHPGRLNSPYYHLAEKYFPRSMKNHYTFLTGSIIAIELRGGRKACIAFMDRLKKTRVCYHLVNLGDVHTIVTAPSVTTHSKMSPKNRHRAGISDGLARISVGLEDVSDLKRAFAECLAAIRS